ncbi:MAG: flagellar export chaperone FlgN [Ilumatobacteraceae bacterium]
MEDLSHQLWTLRELLEELVYKLEVQRLLLGAGKSRWLPSIDAELAAVVAAITEVDTTRQHAQAGLAERCGLSRAASLDDLIAELDDQRAGILRSHRMHLTSLQDQVVEASLGNQDLARQGAAKARDLVAALGGAVSTDVYGPVGQATPLTLASQRIDRTA